MAFICFNRFLDIQDAIEDGQESLNEGPESCTCLQRW
jgi:hypothetical protein